MPPQKKTPLLRVQNPGNESESSDEETERGGALSRLNRRASYTKNGYSIRSQISLSPANSTLADLVIKSPVSPDTDSPPYLHQSSRPNGYRPPATTSNSSSPTSDKTPPPLAHQNLSGSMLPTTMVSSSLPSQSYMLERPFQYEGRGLHERRPSDSQRPMNSPIVNDQSRVIKVLASLDGGERWITVDLTDARSSQIVKDRLFAKMEVPPEQQSYYRIHQQLGDEIGPPLFDDQILSTCQQFGDSASTLRFTLITPTSIAAARATPSSRIPVAQTSAHPPQSPPMHPPLQIDTRLGVDRLLPPAPTTLPPVPPHHTRPLPSTQHTAGTYQTDSNGYIKPPLSAQDDGSEAGSGYSGGPEDTPHILQHTSHLQQTHHTLNRMRSRGRMNIPSMPNPPNVPPPLPPNVTLPQPQSHSSTPSGMATESNQTLTATRMAEKRNETPKEKELPLSLPQGTVHPSWANGGTNVPNNVPPPPIPLPSHMPPQLSLVSTHHSGDHRRPSDTTNKRPNMKPSDSGETEPIELSWVLVDQRPYERPGTSTGVYQDHPPYERPGTSTGMYRDPPSRDIRPPLSPIFRSTSSDGRPRGHDLWASANMSQYSHSGMNTPNGSGRPNGTSHTNIAMRNAFNPKSVEATRNPGPRSPQTTGIMGTPPALIYRDNSGFYSAQNGYSPTTSSIKRGRPNVADTPIVRAPNVPKVHRSRNDNINSYYQAQSPSQDTATGGIISGSGGGRGPINASQARGVMNNYPERGLTTSRSQDNLRENFGFSSSASVAVAVNGDSGNGGSRLSPGGLSRGNTGSRAGQLPPPPNASRYVNTELPPTPSSFPNHPYAPRSPTITTTPRQLANSTSSNASQRSPITSQVRLPRGNAFYPASVPERVGHPYATAGHPVVGSPAAAVPGLASPRQKHPGTGRLHASSDAYSSPPSPPANALIHGSNLMRTLPGNATNPPGISVSTSAPSSSLSVNILPPHPLGPPPPGPPPPLPAHRPSLSDPKYKTSSDDLPLARRQQPNSQIPNEGVVGISGLPTPPSAASPTPPTRMDSLQRTQVRLMSQSSSGGSLSGHTSSPAASPASPRTPLHDDPSVSSPIKRRFQEEIVDDEIGEGTVRQWREGFSGVRVLQNEGTLTPGHFQQQLANLSRSGTQLSRRGANVESQSPHTPTGRSPSQSGGNAPWNLQPDLDEDEDDDGYGDAATSDGGINLWQTNLVKRMSRIYRMGKSLRLSTQSVASRRGDDGGRSELSTIHSQPEESTSQPRSAARGVVPMDTVDLGGTVFEFRPPPEHVLDRMDNFFPGHDLDKPILDNSTAPSGNNSGGNSPTMVDAPYNSGNLAAASLHAPTVLSTATTPTGSPLAATATIVASPMPLGTVTRRRQKKSMRDMAGQRKREMDRNSRDGAASDTMLRRRSTKFWGNVIKEMRPSEIEGFGSSRATPDLPSMPESPGGNKPVVTQWVRGKLLGKGTYGKVYLGFNATSGELFAVKRVEMPESRSDHQDPRQKAVLEAIKAESDTLADLDHPNIVAYLGFEQTDKYFSIFLEYVPGGSIGECYRKLGTGFDQNLTRHCTKQIVDGLAYLHSKNILHRDMKADNILVDLDGVCKISDFGISKHGQNIYHTNEAATTMQGSVFWMAPEVLGSQEGYGGKIDIWSLGCVVLEMCTGERPWHPKALVHVILLLGTTESKQAPPIPEDLNISDEGRDFIDQCFRIEPGARPTAEELKSHPYLKGDWQFKRGAIPN